MLRQSELSTGLLLGLGEYCTKVGSWPLPWSFHSAIVIWWAPCTTWQDGHFISAKWRAPIPIFLANRKIRGTYAHILSYSFLHPSSALVFLHHDRSHLFPILSVFEWSRFQLICMYCGVRLQNRLPGMLGSESKAFVGCQIFTTMSQLCCLLQHKSSNR